MDIKLILLDLDGTLLRSDKTLSEENLRALEETAALGIEIVPASGRICSVMPEAVRALPFIRYAIGANGAEVYDMREQQLLHRADIPLSLAQRVYDYLDTLPVIYDCYLDGVGYIDNVHFARLDEFITDPVVNRMVRSLRTPVENFRDFITARDHPLQKIQMYFKDLDRRDRERARLNSLFPELTATSSLYNNIEMNIQSATKGDALRFLCRHLGLRCEEVMAFGDMGNDLSMIQAAGLGVAMGNAHPQLLAAADYVTDTNDNDGVAKALEKLILHRDKP